MASGALEIYDHRQKHGYPPKDLTNAIYNNIRCYGYVDLELFRRIEARMRYDFSAEDLALLKKWCDADSYAEFINLNRAFLLGETEHSSYYNGPPYAETVPDLPALVRLHDYGILTTSSQPSKTKGPVWEMCNCGLDWYWFHNRQRAYLNFLIPQNPDLMAPQKLVKFIATLMTDERLYVSTFDVYTLNPVQSTFPAHFETNIDKRAETVAGLATAEPRCRNNVHPEATSARIGFKTDIGTMEEANPFDVNVLARSWDLQDLPGIVEAAAIAAGLKPNFAA